MFAEPDPRGGVALVGDQYVAYFPICGREAIGYMVRESRYDRPRSVEEIASQETAEPEEELEVYWEVDDPISASTKEGWVVLGDDSQFGEVTTSLAEEFVWPDSIVVKVFVDTHPDKGFSYDALVYDLARVPEYEDGADLEAIEYLNGGDLMTPEALREASGLCSS